MSRGVAQVLIGVPGVVALIVLLIVAFRRQRADWTATGICVFAVGWLLNGPVAVPTLLGKVYEGVDQYGTPFRIYTAGWYGAFTHLCNYALIGGAVLAAVIALAHKPRVNAPAVAVFSAVVIESLADHASIGTTFSKSRFILLALAAAAAFAKPKGAAFGAAVFGVSFASMAGLATLLNYSAATRACGVGKCGPLGMLWSGIVEDENLLGLSLAASIPFVWLAIRSRRTRAFFVLYLLVMVWFTGSRTALLGAGIVVVACLICGAEPLGTSQRRRAALWALAVLGLGTGLVLPFVTSNPLAYTYRGGLWLVARTRLSGHWLTGLGGDYWGQFAGSTRATQAAIYSVHNQWLDVLFDSGILGLLLFLAALIAIMRRPAGLLLVMPVLWLGITERMISVSQADYFAWVMPALVLASAEFYRSGSTPWSRKNRESSSVKRNIVPTSTATTMNGSPGTKQTQSDTSPAAAAQ